MMLPPKNCAEVLNMHKQFFGSDFKLHNNSWRVQSAVENRVSEAKKNVCTCKILFNYMQPNRIEFRKGWRLSKGRESRENINGMLQSNISENSHFNFSNLEKDIVSVTDDKTMKVIVIK